MFFDKDSYPMSHYGRLSRSGHSYDGTYSVLESRCPFLLLVQIGGHRFSSSFPNHSSQAFLYEHPLHFQLSLGINTLFEMPSHTCRIFFAARISSISDLVVKYSSNFGALVLMRQWNRRRISRSRYPFALAAM